MKSITLGLILITITFGSVAQAAYPPNYYLYLGDVYGATGCYELYQAQGYKYGWIVESNIPGIVKCYGAMTR